MMKKKPSSSKSEDELKRKQQDVVGEERKCGAPQCIYKPKDLDTDKALKKAVRLAMEDLQLKNPSNKYKIKRFIGGKYHISAGDSFSLDLEVTDQIRKSYLYKVHLFLSIFSNCGLEITGKLIPEYVKPVVDEQMLIAEYASVSHHFEKLADTKKNCLLKMFKKPTARAGQFPRTIVWGEKKTECDEVAKALAARNLRVVLSCDEIESEAVSEFRKGLADILVLHGSAPRGLDVDKVAVHVVNLNLPKTMKAYVSRIGCTSRGGRMTSFYTERDMGLMADIKKAILNAESGKRKVQAKEMAAQGDMKVRSGLSKFQNLEDIHCGEPLLAASSSQGHQIITC